MTSTTFVGGKTVKANIRSFARDWPQKKARGLRKVARAILAEAVELCPKDSGATAATGRIVESETGRSVAVVFGDKESEARVLALHEHLSEHSPESWRVAESEGRPVQWTTPGTGPKFLERPWLKHAGTYLQELGEELHVDKK